MGFCILQTLFTSFPVALRNSSMKPSWTMIFWRSWNLSTLERWWTACTRKSSLLSSWLFRRESRGTTSMCLLVNCRCFCYLLFILSYFWNPNIPLHSTFFYNFFCLIWFSVFRGFIRGHSKWKAPGSDASWDGLRRVGHSL